MRGVIRMAVIFVISLAIAKIVAALLDTRSARRLARSTGSEALLTTEGKDVVQKYSRAAASLVLGTVLGRKARQWDLKTGGASVYAGAGWPATLDNAADMLSAGGALARMMADFWRERMEIEKRSTSLS